MRPKDATNRWALASGGQSPLLVAWWLFVFIGSMGISIFSHQFLSGKFSYDAATIREYMAMRDLWVGLSFDSWVNTARVLTLVFGLLSEALAIPLYYALVFLLSVRVLDVFNVDRLPYHLLAGTWLLCGAFFFWQPSKELVALPVALFLCLSRTPLARLAATVVFLGYAALFRQYWAICYFYFVCSLISLRLHVAGRSRLALILFLMAFMVPFMAAQFSGQPPLTEARMMVNEWRVDSPDARSAFSNAFENSGMWTDAVNTLLAWLYMNIPLAMLLDTTPHYVLFALFQLTTLAFFAAGCISYFKQARRLHDPGTTYPRCIAFVVAYSLTQALFEPDFGSFLRHEMIMMIPILIVVFCRAHSGRCAPIDDSGLRPVFSGVSRPSITVN
ncbi:MAG: hypothetical protein Q7U05_10490 [Polaromonas sp.]|nr:hypothetical protein [Polaromonas sp.]